VLLNFGAWKGEHNIMKKAKLALVGVGGYGGEYISFLREFIDPNTYELVAAIDPYADKAQYYPWLCEQNISIYKTLEEFNQKDSADLTIISTPIPLHKEQALFAMAHGSHVLCEKPLVPTLQDAEELMEASKTYKKMFGVGFQWSYCQPILDLKKDVLNRELGKPTELKTYISWRRYDSYYNTSSWKGHIYDSEGQWVLDSVSTNATAHYLFNLFFIMGKRLETSEMPKNVSSGIYRAKNIESYDTCFVRGNFNNGCQFYFISTHSGDEEHNPIFTYTFENAVVTMNEEAGKQEVVAHFNDGRVKNYGDAMSRKSSASKIATMISAINGERIITCPIESIIPHLKVSNAIFDQVDIVSFPDDICYRNISPEGTLVHNLSAQCRLCYDKMLLPSEAGFAWAVSETVLKLDDYTSFSGEKFKKGSE
jgi:predicted dehydrogenase